ncbi:porphobilinogen deaminase [Punctularia strigosozonata HHB-11173 SS5]|uniref:porphobilinogen deaminase n=1 Tax=Punctularia strigosozonata (strain HHB-11173) TaxID=741275 RepID=UPI0004417C0B|nr:porphobilinogen deaminase [Punctularia strigosozonata HHB-11173 SS5]EIN13152.1 porphobilinogen deaminase [Punctularia strigosozonata HHB-11173 SS5]
MASSTPAPAPTGARRSITLASRASQLAQIQTVSVRDALAAAFPSVTFETAFMSTEGDKNQSQALYLLGGKALWTKELEVELLEGRVDMLVHCTKDVPTVLPPGCALAAIAERESAVDSLVVKKGLPYKTLAELPDGAVVGTSSVRRVAQLRRAYPKLTFLDVRGNLNTRLAKLDAEDGPYTAIVLARAGMDRLGFGDRITADIGPPTLYYAVGQGALCIEARADDAFARELGAAITHRRTQWECLAERACLRVLEGGCSVPVGVHTTLVDAGDEGGKSALRMTGCVTGIDGRLHVEHTLNEPVGSLEEAEAVGVQMAKILIDTGAKEILDAVAADREKRVGEAKAADEVTKIETAMDGPTAQA